MTDDAFRVRHRARFGRELHRGEVSAARRAGRGSDARRRTGVACLVVPDDLAARDATSPRCLSYLPDHSSSIRPVRVDRSRRLGGIAAAYLRSGPTASYDVRVVVEDVLARQSFLELPTTVRRRISSTGYGRSAGVPVGSSPTSRLQHAGTLDIEASRKAARFVATCDMFNLTIITFVDPRASSPVATSIGAA